MRMIVVSFFRQCEFLVIAKAICNDSICSAREGLDYIKGSGSGWSHSDELADERTQLSSFIQENIGKNITVIVELKIKMRWFFPLVYLPDIDSQDNKLQVECEQVLDEMLNGKLPVPDVELFDATVSF